MQPGWLLSFCAIPLDDFMHCVDVDLIHGSSTQVAPSERVHPTPEMSDLFILSNVTPGA